MTRTATCLLLLAMGCSTELPGTEDHTRPPGVGGDMDALDDTEPGQTPDAGTFEPQPDAGAPEDQPLSLVAGATPFMPATPPTTDVTSAVVGGTPPYECYVYEGVAPGTMPALVELDGCTLAGGISEWDAPGVFGFTVTVVDREGATVDVPIVYEGTPCATAEVEMTPATTINAMTIPAGAARDWRIDVTDVDAIDTSVGCDACLTMSMLTRSPLQPSAQLDCDSPGSLCSDSDNVITMHDECPAAEGATARRFVNLREHAPVRADGGPGWITVELNVNYSGASLNPCGGKSWACHVELLELQ